jgi:hypothetical protein
MTENHYQNSNHMETVIAQNLSNAFPVWLNFIQSLTCVEQCQAILQVICGEKRTLHRMWVICMHMCGNEMSSQISLSKCMASKPKYCFKQ